MYFNGGGVSKRAPRQGRESYNVMKKGTSIWKLLRNGLVLPAERGAAPF